MKRFTSFVLALSLFASSLVVVPQPSAAKSILNNTVWIATNPTSSASILTTYSTELTSASTKYGYTQTDE